MRELFYILAVILIFAWLLGYAVFSAGSFIHLAIPLAIISLLLTIGKRKEA